MIYGWYGNTYGLHTGVGKNLINISRNKILKVITFKNILQAVIHLIYIALAVKCVQFVIR